MLVVVPFAGQPSGAQVPGQQHRHPGTRSQATFPTGSNARPDAVPYTRSVPRWLVPVVRAKGPACVERQCAGQRCLAQHTLRECQHPSSGTQAVADQPGMLLRRHFLPHLLQSRHLPIRHRLLTNTGIQRELLCAGPSRERACGPGVVTNVPPKHDQKDVSPDARLRMLTPA